MEIEATEEKFEKTEEEKKVNDKVSKLHGIPEVSRCLWKQIPECLSCACHCQIMYKVINLSWKNILRGIQDPFAIIAEANCWD